MNEIIFLSQVGSSLKLYANCVKNGYNKLHYFTDPETENEIILSGPEAVIQNLTAGEWFFYAENEQNETIGHTSIIISQLLSQTIFQNVLTCANISDVELPENLNTEDYVTQLYDLNVSEETILAFVNFYNLRQEEINTATEPEFYIRQNQINSNIGISYTFVPYEKDGDKWKRLNDSIVYDSEKFIFYGKPRRMYQIFVLSDFSVVRKYFIYEPSKTLSETKYERRISALQNWKEKTTELLENIALEELENDAYGRQIIASMVSLRNRRAIFKKPVVELDDNTLLVTISDYPCIALTDKNVYLAAIETEEACAESFRPHKYKIIEEQNKIPLSSLLINSDTDYLFYLTDDTGTILSDIFMFSTDSKINDETYNKVYNKIVFDDFKRKLYNVSQEYGKKEWESVSLLLDQYLFTDNSVNLTEFLLQQLIRQDENRVRIDFLIQLVLLCKLRYYDNINQDFIKQQVFSQEFKSHVLPENSPYIIKITRLNGDTISYNYLSAGKESTSIRMDKDDFIFLQCIDPSSWNVSSIAFYNNRVKSGRPYFYFPKLEVEVI